jgi:TonB family protein
MAGVLYAAAAVAQHDRPELADTQALKLVSYTAPSVPRLGTDGSAVVAFTVRADGRVDDAVTLVASDRRVADPAREAVMKWRFERDAVLGRGRDAQLDVVLRREVVEFVFKRDKVTGMNHREGAKAWFPEDGRSAVRTVPSTDLDASLVRGLLPVHEDAAEPPASSSVGGRATLSFVIDETGKVRVPIVETADAPEVAAAALAVVARWVYDPPTADGRPVLVEERKTLTFRPTQH